MLVLKLVRGGEGLEGLKHQVQVPAALARFTIGRDPACDWCIPDRTLALSARHCEIVRVDGKTVLRDLSTNGTFVNGARERLPADHLLRAGDRLVMGSFHVEVGEATEMAAAAEAARPAGARRGGDPAAMVGADWERVAIQPAAASGAAMDVKTGLTRISKPPPRQPNPDPRPAAAIASGTVPGAPAPSPAAVPAAATAAASGDLIARLSQALGVSPQALGTADGAMAAERVARLLRAAMQGLHLQLAAQARQQRQLGSRAQLATPTSDAARLRLAAGPEDVLAILLAAGDGGPALVHRAGQDVAAHATRLLAAVGAASTRLGEQLSPATLERSAKGPDDAVGLWRLYGSIWQAMGLPADQAWSRGFGEALSGYVAAAYDEAASKAQPAS